MVTYPVMMFLMNQLSLVWLTVMGEGAGVGIFLSGVTMVMWLDMIPFPLSCQALVFNFFTVCNRMGLL